MTLLAGSVYKTLKTVIRNAKIQNASSASDLVDIRDLGVRAIASVSGLPSNEIQLSPS